MALTGYQPHEILKSAVISSGLKWPFGLNDARTLSAAFEKISFVKIISWTSLAGRPRRFVGALVFISGLKSRNKLPRRIGEILIGIVALSHTIVQAISHTIVQAISHT